jgi:hypothetical protein
MELGAWEGGNTLRSEGQARLRTPSANGVQLPIALEDAEPIMHCAKGSSRESPVSHS